MCELPPLGCQKETTPHVKVWVQSGEKESDFLAHCVYQRVFILSAVSLCSRALHSKQDKHVFRNLWGWKNNPTTCTVQGFHYCVRPECWQDFTHCFCVQCFQLQHVTSAMMWCLQMCRTLRVFRRGNTWRPKTILGSNVGLFFFSLFFFPWQTVKLSPAVRDKMPRTWSKFDRLPKSCHPRGCK